MRKGYCVTHQMIRADVYPHRTRDQAVQRLYDTVRWEQIRIRQLSNEPWCAACLADGLYTPATDVDHVTPHRGDQEKFFAGPFQSLCHSCHSRKTIREMRAR